MINSLIEKYKERLEELDKVDNRYQEFSKPAPEYIYYQTQECETFLKDLEKLKEDIKKLNISSINAPTEAMMIFLKNEIIYKEEELFKCVSI